MYICVVFSYDASQFQPSVALLQEDLFFPDLPLELARLVEAGVSIVQNVRIKREQHERAILPRMCVAAVRLPHAGEREDETREQHRRGESEPGPAHVDIGLRAADLAGVVFGVGGAGHGPRRADRVGQALRELIDPMRPVS
jgi:hypothetical protein